MIKTIGIILGILIITGIVLFALFGQRSELDEAENNTPTTPIEVATGEGLTDEISPTEQEIEETEQPSEDVAQLAQSSVGSYEAYSAEKIVRATTGDVVLFFHASWCPTCRALSGDIEKNVSAIPAGVTILKTDYDTETELKKKYGVTTQHTLVQVDENGTLIKKWSGGSKLENLLSEIQ